MKLTDFIDSVAIPSSLVRSTVRQCGGWDSFKEMAEDVSRHGAGGGFHGFIYYTETVAFARRNKAALLDHIKEQAKEFGEPSPAAFVAAFHCLDGYEAGEIEAALYTGKGEAATQVYNALAWYALEEVSRAYSDKKDEY